MCGFVSAVSFEGQPRQETLRFATTQLAHRGPDDEAFYFSQAFSAGFRRLKILDLSERGRQPMTDPSGRFCIVFNGEIYNYLELRNELKQHGLRFRTDTDTEVLLTAYLQWKEGCLSRLNGMFAFLIWDSEKQELFGARDRFGEKPLFVAQTPRGIFFASEIKALFPLLGHVPDYRPGVVQQYLTQGVCDVGRETFYQGIDSLPAAHILVVKNGSLHISRYWELVEREPFRGDAIGAFRELWLDSLRLRLRSDVPVGSCLSGGLDSGAIVCGLPHVLGVESTNVTRKTFTAAYTEYDESKEVTLVNAQSGSTGYSIVPRPDGLESLSRLLWFHDEPFQSYSVFAGHEVMRLAKQEGVTVLLNGQGADELLAGYGDFLTPYVAQLLREGRLPSAIDGLSGAGVRRNQGVTSCLAESLRLVASRGAIGHWYRAARSRWKTDSSPSRQWNLRPEFIEAAKNDPLERRPSGTSNLLKSEIIQETSCAPLPLFLRVEDRNSMANSIESRLPFLDHRLAELVFSFPTRVFMQGGENKHLLREAMRGILPEAVRTRKDKFGFPVPQAPWVFDGLAGVLDDAPSARAFAERGIFDVAALRRRLDRERGSGDRTSWSFLFFFRVLCLESWLRGTKHYAVRPPSRIQGALAGERPA